MQMSAPETVLPLPLSRRIDWLAPLLELAPFSAMLVLFASILLDSLGLLVAAVGVALLSGGGWWRTGRGRTGLIIALGRAIVFVYGLGWGLTARVNEIYGPEQATHTSAGQHWIDGALLFFLISTIASAVAVGVLSYRDAAGRAAAG